MNDLEYLFKSNNRDRNEYLCTRASTEYCVYEVYD